MRELQSALLQAAFLADGDVIEPEHFDLDTFGEKQEEESYSLHENERKTIEEALKASHGNIARAAKMPQIGRNTLYRKIASYGIECQQHAGLRRQPNPPV